MFKQAIRGAGLPKYLSSDHDPLYRFHQWEANLRILDVTEIKTVPYTPCSHPFVERLVGTIRRKCLICHAPMTEPFKADCLPFGINGEKPVAGEFLVKLRWLV